MNNYIAAYGDKILSWLVTVGALLTAASASNVTHPLVSLTAAAWITFACAALNAAHGVFFPPAAQQAAKAALKRWPSKP